MQVGMMGNVFTNASKVIAWLQDPCSAIAAQDSNQLGVQAVTEAINYGTLELSELEVPFFIAALLRLMTHEYWTRAWIVQELVLNDKVEVLWEQQKSTWKDLRDFLVRELYSPDMSDLQLKIKEWYDVDISMLPIYGLATFQQIDNSSRAADLSTRASLIALVIKFQYQQCSHPYDHIFAYIGIAAALNRVIFQPDYSEPCASLLFRLAAHHPDTISIDEINILARLCGSFPGNMTVCSYGLGDNNWSINAHAGKSMSIPWRPVHSSSPLCDVCGTLGQSLSHELLVSVPQSLWHFVFVDLSQPSKLEMSKSCLLTHIVNLNVSGSAINSRCRSFRAVSELGTLTIGFHDHLYNLRMNDGGLFDKVRREITPVGGMDSFLNYVNVARALDKVNDIELICMEN